MLTEPLSPSSSPTRSPGRGRKERRSASPRMMGGQGGRSSSPPHTPIQQQFPPPPIRGRDGNGGSSGRKSRPSRAAPPVPGTPGSSSNGSANSGLPQQRPPFVATSRERRAGTAFSTPDGRPQATWGGHDADSQHGSGIGRAQDSFSTLTSSHEQQDQQHNQYQRSSSPTTLLDSEKPYTLLQEAADLLKTVEQRKTEIAQGMKQSSPKHGEWML